MEAEQTGVAIGAPDPVSIEGNYRDTPQWYCAHLVEYAAIVWVESSLVEEQAFLHCTVSAPGRDLAGMIVASDLDLHTSLEAVDWRG